MMGVDWRKWLAVGAFLTVGFCLGGAVVLGTTEPETVTVNPTQEELAQLEQTRTELESRQEQLQLWEDELSAEQQIVDENTITDGTWTVGVDVNPGEYRAEDVRDICYWVITTTGSNGEDIIQNDVPGGGNPTVVLEEGQDFKSLACGEWTLQR